jgi:hypothetical protein
MTFPMPTFTPYLPFKWCYNVGSGTSISVPSCVKANSIIIWSAVRTSNQAYPSGPSGFTQVSGTGYTGGGEYYNYCIWYKIATGSETTLSTGGSEASIIVIVINPGGNWTYSDNPINIVDTSSPYSISSGCSTYALSPLPPYYPAILLQLAMWANVPGSTAISDPVMSPYPCISVTNGDNHTLGFKYFSKNSVDTTITGTIPSSTYSAELSGVVRLYR